MRCSALPRRKEDHLLPRESFPGQHWVLCSEWPGHARHSPRSVSHQRTCPWRYGQRQSRGYRTLVQVACLVWKWRPELHFLALHKSLLPKEQLFVSSTETDAKIFEKFSVKTKEQREISKERGHLVWTSDLGPLRSAAKPPLISSKSGFKSSPTSESMWKASTFSSGKAVCTCVLRRCSPVAFAHTISWTASLSYQQLLCQRILCQPNFKKIKKKLLQKAAMEAFPGWLYWPEDSTFSQVTGDFFSSVYQKQEFEDRPPPPWHRVDIWDQLPLRHAVVPSTEIFSCSGPLAVHLHGNQQRTMINQQTWVPPAGHQASRDCKCCKTHVEGSRNAGLGTGDSSTRWHQGEDIPNTW